MVTRSFLDNYWKTTTLWSGSLELGTDTITEGWFGEASEYSLIALTGYFKGYDSIVASRFWGVVKSSDITGSSGYLLVNLMGSSLQTFTQPGILLANLSLMIHDATRVELKLDNGTSVLRFDTGNLVKVPSGKVIFREVIGIK